MSGQQEETYPDFDFESVFEVEDYMYFYSEMLTEERTARQVAAIDGLLKNTGPLKILDLACGFGRHANLLAQRGHQVLGIDLTPGFLEIARNGAAEYGVQVDYRQGDMRLIDFDSEFDCVLLLFTAFGYFSDEQNQQVMDRIARSLKPGGMALFDTMSRDGLFKRFLPFIVTEKDGNLMIDRNAFDTITGRLYNRRIVIREGVRRDKPFFVRLYNPTEITRVVQEAGLQVENIFSDWEGTLMSADSHHMVVVARKP